MKPLHDVMADDADVERANWEGMAPVELPDVPDVATDRTSTACGAFRDGRDAAGRHDERVMTNGVERAVRSRETDELASRWRERAEAFDKRAAEAQASGDQYSAARDRWRARTWREAASELEQEEKA